MQTTTITSSQRQSFAGGPRVTERVRGTAHPEGWATRDRVARSLLLRPEAATERYVRL